ncbi:MAG: lamin tail domain-containing protein [Kiritimatiellae bacterium]|nr:lamin tail domain-containing protein [Kiritimatiellia bacterium]
MKSTGCSRQAFLLVAVLAFSLMAAGAKGGTLVARATSWRYFKGTVEASDPRSEWRAYDFDDSGWAAGQAPFGYPSTDVATYFSDMQNSYTTFFIRKTFEVTSLDEGTRLRVGVNYDDGFIIWINGEPVFDRNEPDGPPLHDSLASDYGDSAGAYEEFELPDPQDYLEIGQNVIAVQAFNKTPDSSDCRVDVELTSYLKVADTTFSHDRGFYSAPFVCTIQTATPGATIKYTLNGSDPRVSSSAMTVNASSAAVTIDPDSSTGRLINGGKAPCVVLRAYALKGGYDPTDADTQSYLFVHKVPYQPDVMASENWIPGENPKNRVIDRDPARRRSTVMDSALRSEPYFSSITNSLRALPTLSVCAEYGDIFGDSYGVWHNSLHYGDGWDRAASVEWIEADGTSGFQSDCAMQCSGGGANRDPRYKTHVSLTFEFKRAYGPPRLDYPLFPNSPVEDMNGFRIRAHASDSWASGENVQMVRESFARMTQRALNWPAAPQERWAHVYINGMYWGFYQVLERLGADFLASSLGGDEADYDVIGSKRWGDCIPTPTGTYRVKSGDSVAWEAVRAAANAGDYAQVLTYLDVAQYIDYHLLEEWGGNGDWAPPFRTDPGNNFRAARKSRNRRPGDMQWNFFVWDYDYTLDHTATIYAATNFTYGTWSLHLKLKGKTDYKALFADRLFRHMLEPDGVLTPDSARARYMEAADDIQPHLFADLARWNWQQTVTVGTITSVNHYNQWIARRDRITNDWCRLRTDFVVSYYRSQGLYPTVAPPTYTQHGGAIAAGFQLGLSNPNTSGSIRYTLDGTDPRLAGGAVSGAASTYGGPIALAKTTHVRARIYKTTTTWSAEHAHTFNYTGHYSKIRITEIHYNPLGGSDYEFVEVQNTGSSERGLSEMTFDGIRYTFPPGVELGPGETALLVSNESVFTNRYPSAKGLAAFFGEYRGRLSNGGERLSLLDCEGRTVISVRYNDKYPWPESADGDGFSLVPVTTDGDQDDAAKWRASNLIGGSPGYEDGEPYRVVISEALTHTDLPDVDTIELYNAGTAEANIGGWYLSDTIANYRKYAIPAGTIVPGGGYVLFDEHDFNTDTNSPSCFALSSHGDEIYLTKWDGAGNLQYLAEARFGGSANGVAFARYTKTDGDVDFVAQSVSNTLGAANVYPAVGPVVISELMYHPAGTGVCEYVELHNLSDATVALYDTANPANRWQVSAAVNYVFPAGATLGAKEYALVVPTNEAAFRAQYPGVPGSVQVFGPYEGQLSNGGESVKLWRPDTPDPEGVPLILVDRVQYNDNSPWPENADGKGPSLERQDAAAYGNDPANWAASVAAGGTPGQPNSGGLVSKTSGWRYHDRGEDLGTAWRGAYGAYDDGAWDDGNGPLGYGYTNADTEVSYGDNPAGKPMTTYFRKTFTLGSDPEAITNLTLAALYDDGFVAYLNGQESARASLPAGTISYGTAASSHTATDYEAFDLTAHKSKLVQGLNVLAVEVHQTDPGSSDLLMDLELTYAAVIGNPPAAPTGLGASAASSSRINLSWTDASNNETGFKIDRRQSGSEVWTRIATTGANVSTYSDTGLAAGTTYYYRVKAYNGDGNSPYSNDAAATTQQGPPAAPSGLTATAASASRIELLWTDASGNETGFKIERSPTGSSSWQQIATAGADASTYTDSGLTPGTAYYYRVRATNGIGDSGYSNIDAATTTTISVQFAASSSSGREDVSPATLTVTLNEASPQTVTVGYAATGGTASGGGVDYTLASGTLNFSPGQTSRPISVSIADDETDEPDETIVVTLSGPSNAALGSRPTHTYTITDNDQLFVAYNDLCWTSTQAAAVNVTTYSRTDSGLLVDHNTGQDTAVTLAIDSGGAGPYETQGVPPDSGTDAYAVFDGKVDCAGLISYGEDLTLTFSGLDASLRYEFVLFGNRGNSSYTDRTATTTISGADAFENASTAGAVIQGTGNSQTVICNGWNTQNGYVARYRQIDAGSDGTFVITISDNASKFYANALMLRASRPQGQQTTVKVPGSGVWRYAKGTQEVSDPLAGWVQFAFDDSGWASGPGPFGYSSDAAEGPFGTTLDDMRDTYSCVFLRREFAIDTPALVSELKLNATYDDGFIVWVNGRELARVNVSGEPGSFVPYNSFSTTQLEPTAWTASFMGADLPELTRTNRVAVQLLNGALGSSDLKLELELAVVEGSPMSTAADFDQDGMSDAWENEKLGGTGQSTEGDADGDGRLNIEEYIAGTDPDNSNSTFRVDMSAAGGSVIASFDTVAANPTHYPGVTRGYALEQRTGLDGTGMWQGVPGYTNILGAGQAVAYTNASPGGATYYRGRVWLQSE